MTNSADHQTHPSGSEEWLRKYRVLRGELMAAVASGNGAPAWKSVLDRLDAHVLSAPAVQTRDVRIETECPACAVELIVHAHEDGSAMAMTAGVQTERAPELCSVCGGQPLASGRQCICGGVGTEQAEMHGLREELLSWEIAAGWIPALRPESSDKHRYFGSPVQDGAHAVEDAHG